LATGLLVICTGKFTKNIETLQAQEKEYEAVFMLGATTPSYDRETEIDAQFAFDHITLEDIEHTIKSFIGPQDQVPPVFSAKQIDGKRAYLSARQGQEVEMKTVQIQINSFELLSIDLPKVKVRINCSKGTYIRSLARDFGQRLHSGAYLFDLRRTVSGEFSINNAITIGEFEKIIKNLQPIKK
jgi:tRNA pseudouridine55 synthase